MKGITDGSSPYKSVRVGYSIHTFIKRPKSTFYSYSYFLYIILNKINIICCNWCNFSVYHPSSRAQGFEIQKNETAICAIYWPIIVLTDWKRLIYIERIAAENKYLER